MIQVIICIISIAVVLQLSKENCKLKDNEVIDQIKSDILEELKLEVKHDDPVTNTLENIPSKMSAEDFRKLIQ